MFIVSELSDTRSVAAYICGIRKSAERTKIAGQVHRTSVAVDAGLSSLAGFRPNIELSARLGSSRLRYMNALIGSCWHQ